MNLLYFTEPICVCRIMQNTLTIGSKCERLPRSEEHTSELQSQSNLVCRLLLEKKKMLCLKAAIPFPALATINQVALGHAIMVLLQADRMLRRVRAVADRAAVPVAVGTSEVVCS